MKNKIKHAFFWKIFDKFFFRLLMFQKRHRKEIDSLVQKKLYQLNFFNQNIERKFPTFKKSLDVRYPEYIFSDAIKRVVIIKLDHIGDVFLCKDALISLYKKLPYARFTILSSSGCEAIFRSWGFSEVIACDIFTNEGCASKKMLPLEDTLQTIRALSPDLAVDLRLDAKESNAILSELNAKMTASFYYDSDFYLSEDVVNVFSNRLQLLQLVDRIPIIERPKNTGNGRLIGLAPFATVENKTWNLENWMDLAKKLHGRGEQVVFFGHRSTKRHLKKFQKNVMD